MDSELGETSKTPLIFYPIMEDVLKKYDALRDKFKQIWMAR